MGLRVKKGQTIKSLRDKLRALPRTVSQEIAQKAAPVFTQDTREAFNAGRTAYDEPRPLGFGADPKLTLVASGAIKDALMFASEGTRIRAVLGPKTKAGVEYGRFLIGKYKILPNGRIPLKWQGKIDSFIKGAVDRQLKGGG